MKLDNTLVREIKTKNQAIWFLINESGIYQIAKKNVKERFI